MAMRRILGKGAELVVGDSPEERGTAMADRINQIFAEVRRIAAEAFASAGRDVLSLRDQFIDRAANCRERGENEKAEVWEEAAQLLTPLGLSFIPGEAGEE